MDKSELIKNELLELAEIPVNEIGCAGTPEIVTRHSRLLQLQSKILVFMLEGQDRIISQLSEYGNIEIRNGNNDNTPSHFKSSDFFQAQYNLTKKLNKEMTDIKDSLGDHLDNTVTKRAGRVSHFIENTVRPIVWAVGILIAIFLSIYLGDISKELKAQEQKIEKVLEYSKQ